MGLFLLKPQSGEVWYSLWRQDPRTFGERLQCRPPRLDLSRISIVLVKVWIHRGTTSAAVSARRGESSFGPQPCISYFFLRDHTELESLSTTGGGSQLPRSDVKLSNTSNLEKAHLLIPLLIALLLHEHNSQSDLSYVHFQNPSASDIVRTCERTP